MILYKRENDFKIDILKNSLFFQIFDDNENLIVNNKII